MHCHCKYTPEPKQHGYSDEIRKQAVQIYVEGMNWLSTLKPVTLMGVGEDVESIIAAMTSSNSHAA